MNLGAPIAIAPYAFATGLTVYEVVRKGRRWVEEKLWRRDQAHAQRRLSDTGGWNVRTWHFSDCIEPVDCEQSDALDRLRSLYQAEARTLARIAELEQLYALEAAPDPKRLV